MGIVIDLQSARNALHILAKRDSQVCDEEELLDVPPAKIKRLLQTLTVSEQLRISLRMNKGAK